MKVRVIAYFTLEKFKELTNVNKVAERKENEFDIGDTFECDEEMYRYLTGGNKYGRIVVEPMTVKADEVQISKKKKDRKKRGAK